MQNLEFTSLNIVSLNVRGLRDLTKRKALFLFCKHTDADFVLLQETHSCESDCKFWKSQWGNSIYFDHGTNHSAGLMILFHKFKGDVFESASSSDGRWLLLVIKVDNMLFILCNVYGYNSQQCNRVLFSDLATKMLDYQNKYTNAKLIVAGDFNEAPDNLMDRFPSRLSQGPKANNIISSLCNKLTVVDPWRFFNDSAQDFTWCNGPKTLKSRIDFFLISPPLLQHVNNVCHLQAPLTDHKMISLKLLTSGSSNGCRGYWKLNISLLDDPAFNLSVEECLSECFDSDTVSSYGNKWELFKFKVRGLAIKRSKELKRNKLLKESALMLKLENLLQKNSHSEEEILELKTAQLELDKLYIDLAKGSFIRSRAKWIEEGEKNSNYFFALEKRNYKRKSLSALNINNTLCKDPTEISNFISAFYENLYKSQFQEVYCDAFLQQVLDHSL